MPPTLRAAFAAAHRMRHRVHRRSAIVRPTPSPTLSSRLAERDIHVVGVAENADGRAAFGTHAPHFAAGERQLRPLPFTGRKRGTAPGAAANLPAAAGLHLHIMDR